MQVLHYAKYQSGITMGSSLPYPSHCSSFTIHNSMALRLQNTSQWPRASVTAVMCFTLTLDSLTELVGHLSHLTQWIRLVVIVFLQHAVTHPQTMLIRWHTRLHFNQRQTPSVNTERRDTHTFFYVLCALFYVPPYVCHSRSVITTPLNRCINNTVQNQVTTTIHLLQMIMANTQTCFYCSYNLDLDPMTSI